MRYLFVIAAAFAPLFGQVAPPECTVSVLPAVVRDAAEADLMPDQILTCQGGPTSPPASVLFNLTVFLNTNVTSRITNTTTSETEALLLIDDPQPGVANTSNGFPYFGQVLGTAGVLAGTPGSGNVYQGVLTAPNGIVFPGVPYVTGSVRTFRIVNVRGNAALLGGGGPIKSFISISGPTAILVNSPINDVAFVLPGLAFTPTVGSPPSGIDLKFQEGFASAFKKRIENTPGGPLTAIRQDVPGALYCTESGFTPEFSAVTPGAIGSANTGTRLLAHFAGLPSSVFVLIVPDQVVSSTGALVAHRVFPPFAADDTGGFISTFSGNSLVFVTPGHTADLLYEVTAAAPFQGVHGCFTIESITIHASAFFPVPLTSATVTGKLAPRDPTAVASPTAPGPRFVP